MSTCLHRLLTLVMMHLLVPGHVVGKDELFIVLHHASVSAQPQNHYRKQASAGKSGGTVSSTNSYYTPENSSLPKIEVQLETMASCQQTKKDKLNLVGLGTGTPHIVYRYNLL